MQNDFISCEHCHEDFPANLFHLVGYIDQFGIVCPECLEELRNEESAANVEEVAA